MGPRRPQLRRRGSLWFLVGGRPLHRRTPSSPYQHYCSAPAPPDSSRCRTRSSSTRSWCSWCCRRLWSVSHRARLRRPRPTSSRARSGSSTMALLVAITGIVATMPYIAAAAGRHRSRTADEGHRGCRASWPLIVAFAFVHRCPTPTESGPAGPALIAFVKDILIYMVIMVAIIYIPAEARRLERASSARAEAKFGKSPNLEGRRHPAERRPTSWQYATAGSGLGTARCSCTRTRITGVLATPQPRASSSATCSRCRRTALVARPARRCSATWPSRRASSR